MKIKTKFKPTIGQAIKMLLCAICRVEMSMEIETEEVRHICKPNAAQGRAVATSLKPVVGGSR